MTACPACYSPRPGAYVGKRRGAHAYECLTCGTILATSPHGNARILGAIA